MLACNIIFYIPDRFNIFIFFFGKSFFYSYFAESFLLTYRCQNTKIHCHDMSMVQADRIFKCVFYNQSDKQ